MKTLRKSVLLALIAVFSLAAALFAAACGKKITVSYELGTGASAMTNQVAPGEQMDLPAPTRDGYFFGGWYENAQFTGDALEGKITAPEQDKTYYARWLKGYNLTLDLGGGTIGGSSEALVVSVPETGNLLEWIERSTSGAPQRGSLSFGGWLKSDSTEVTATDVMPSADLSLKAGFKVSYTVEAYAQVSPHDDNYERSEELSFTDSGYLGTSLDLREHDFVNYTVNEAYANADAPSKFQGELKENASENAFRVYLDRAQFSISYNANIPASGLEATGKMISTYYVYGEQAEVQKNLYQIEGYRFAGWSESPNGKIDFRPGMMISSGDYSLYAIWDKGYGDVFGSSDYIFFPSAPADPDVVLVRGGYEFKGERGEIDADMNFTAKEDGSFVSFEGKFIAKLIGDRYSLYFQNRIGEYTLYDGYYNSEKKAVNGYNDSVKLKLDGFNNATLTENGSPKDGTYAFDPEKGEFVLSIRGNSDKYFRFGIEGDRNYFSYFGKEKGEYSQFVRGGVGATYYLGTQMFTLDGYGNAIRSMEGFSDLRGTYEPVDNNESSPLVSLHFDTFDMRICINILDSDMGNCVMVDENICKEFKNGNDTLSLDGVGAFPDSATYTHDGNAETFDFFVEQNLLGMIVHLVRGYNTEAYTFLLDEENSTFSKSDVAVSRFVTGLGSYNGYTNVYMAEYNEQYVKPEQNDGDRKGAFNSNIKDDEIPQDAKRTEVFLQMGGVYVRVYKGFSYVDPEYRLHRFKATWWAEKSADSFYIDFFYQTNSNFAGGSIFYMFLQSYYTIDGDGNRVQQTQKDPETGEESTYHPSTSTATILWGSESDDWSKRFEDYFLIWNVNYACDAASSFEGFCNFFVDKDGNLTEGSLQYYVLPEAAVDDFGGESLFEFKYRDEDDPTQFHSMYFCAKRDDGGFGTKIKILPDRPYFMQRFNTEMKGQQFNEGYDSLYLIGDENHTAIYYRSSEDAQNGTGAVKGTYESLGVANGHDAFRFVPSGDTDVQPFEFTIETIGTDWQDGFTFYHVYNDADNKTYSIQGGGTFRADGYGSYACYTNKDGEVREGGYIFSEDRRDIGLYNSTNGTSITIEYAFAISPDDPNLLIPQKEEEKSAYFVLFNSAGVFPEGFAQGAVIFNSEEGTVEITTIGDYIWVQQGEQESYSLFASGTYVLVDEVDHLYDLSIILFNYDTGEPRTDDAGMPISRKWRCKLENGYCFVMDDEEVYGSYADDDNAVFYLDGWGGGCYIDGEGNRYDGSHNIVGRSSDGRYCYGIFGGVEGEPELLYAARYDTRTRKFVITNDPDKGQWVSYYADDFGAVEFCQVFAIDNVMIGYWFLDEKNQLVIYEFDWEVGYVNAGNAYVTPDFNDPNGVVYYDFSNDQRAFHRWVPGTKYTFTGKVVFDEFLDMTEEQKKTAKMPAEIEGLTLEFEPDGTALMNAPAKLHFKHGDIDETYEYTIVATHPTTAQNAAGYLRLDAFYGEKPFYVEVDYAYGKGDNTFVFHAAGVDYVWSDYPAVNFPDYVFDCYGTVTSGLKYSIGPREWGFEEWGSDKGGDHPDMLICGVIHVPDSQGDLITFSGFYEDIFGVEKTDGKGNPVLDESKIVNHDATIAALNRIDPEGCPVYEVLVKDRHDPNLEYSIWLEKLTDAYGNWSSIIYAVNIYKEVQKTENNETFVYRAWQFLGAYYASFAERSIYTLDAYKKGTDGKNESLVQGYTGAKWYDNDVIFFKADSDGNPIAKDESGKENDMILFSFELDENRLVKSASHKKVKFIEVTPAGQDENDQYTFTFFVVEGSNKSIEAAYICSATRKTKQENHDTGATDVINVTFSNELNKRVEYERGTKSKDGKTFLFYFVNPISITVKLSGTTDNAKVEWQTGVLDFEDD